MAEHTPHIAPTLSPGGSLAGKYFDELYARAADPWAFQTSTYEAGKYAATLAALPREKYPAALELGCSIGVLTRQLAPRCEQLVAVDFSKAALDQARARCADQPWVTFEQRDLATTFPRGLFDLILVSEIGYYFSAADLNKLRAKIAAALAPRGHVLLVHYTGETNYPLTADAVHATFLGWKNAPWQCVRAESAEGYRLDLLGKTAC